ncbi:MAG: DNA double-strand break repair nuclease NurA [Tissierellia bacterium]|nr:DNA double-strand break repair nuclease NurA [Tissierellia bacterium]
MFNLNEELKGEIRHINNTLLDKYKELLSMDKNLLRKFIDPHIGKIKKLARMSPEELKKYAQLGGIVGVDGSKNRLGGAYPHFIEIYQGLAKSTLQADKPVFKAKIYTPLQMEENPNILEDSKEEKIRSDKNLADIEVEAALAAIREFDPYAVIMDGSIIRYDIASAERWMELKTECEEKGIILVGVTKDIKTSIIGEELKKEKNISIGHEFRDRELLYGTLEYGEAIFINIKTKKELAGLESAFLRSSDSPTVIAVDILESQKEYLEEMVRLVLTLTPKNGRGVPLWIDIVDSEVKISDSMIRSLLESYLDRRLLEMLFISERDKRTI